MRTQLSSGAEIQRDSLKSPVPISHPTRLLAVAAVLFSLAFQALFYSTPLYNSAAKAEERLIRWDLLQWATRPSQPGNPNWLKTIGERFGQPENLKQRLPAIGFAAAAWFVAWLAGRALRSTIVPPAIINRTELLAIDLGLGIGALSLAILGLGLAGHCDRRNLQLIAALATIAAVLASKRARKIAPLESKAASDEASLWRWPLLAGTACFALLALLAAGLPTTDYDALAYHLLGPKEWFERGRIEHLPHNVYTVFPFLTEMFAFAGMSYFGDWFSGGLAGQATLWGFGPATALAVGALAATRFGSTAGWLAAFAYMSTPWTYRLSSIPYVEGAMNYFAVAALLAALRTREGEGWSFIAGILGGCAASCKYPGLVFVAAPTLLVVCWIAAAAQASAVSKLGNLVRHVGVFAFGIAVAFGPWLARNYSWTGNPVFPLMSSAFATHNWSPEKAERFDAAHRSKTHTLADAVEHASIVTHRSDWQTPLAFAFAPLALLHWRERRTVLWLWILVLAIFTAFWGLTHRLDRFFLTLEPPLIVLAAAGMTWNRSTLWRTIVVFSIAVAAPYQAAYCTSGLCGPPNYTADLRTQWRQNWRLEPAVQVANDDRLVRGDAVVLFVGYAGVYDCLPPRLYSTVFDDNIFEQIVHNPQGGPAALLPDFRIRSALEVLNVDAIVVDWSWIRRYREPGNYGYSNFVQPAAFERLCGMGILSKVALPAELAAGGIELYRLNHPRRGIELKSRGVAE